MGNRTVGQEQRKPTAALRRVLSRTLVLFGGTVACTAAAWAISTACAGADTAPTAPPTAPAFALPQPEIPGLTEGRELAGKLVDGLGALLDPEHAKTAVEDIGRDLAEHLIPPTAPPGQPDGGAVVVPVEVSAPVAQQLAPQIRAVPAVVPEAAAPAVAPTPVDETAATPGAEERALADGLTRRGFPRAETSAPLQPRAPSSQDPFTAPAPVSPGHTSGSGGSDAPTLGLLSATPADTELFPVSVLRTDGVQVPAATGTQPGVTPD